MLSEWSPKDFGFVLNSIGWTNQDLQKIVQCRIVVKKIVKNIVLPGPLKSHIVPIHLCGTYNGLKVESNRTTTNWNPNHPNSLEIRCGRKKHTQQDHEITEIFKPNSCSRAFSFNLLDRTRLCVQKGGFQNLDFTIRNIAY